MSTLYARIGANYSATRKEDPRIAALITQALGDARSADTRSASRREKKAPADA